MFIDGPASPALFAAYAPVALNDAAAPPFPGQEADEEEDDPTTLGRDFDFERVQAAWAPIPPTAPSGPLPIRFVDGSIQSRTVGALRVGYRQRPLICAAVSAATLRLDGRQLHREADPRTLKVLCLNSNGMAPEDLTQARVLLANLGIVLLTSETEDPSNFDAMRRSTRGVAMTAMEELERDVMLADNEIPTLVDGLLERRLAGGRQDVPVLGLVKRQIASYLPAGLQELAYSLKPGERTPAFVLETVQHVDIVNTYIRLSAPPGASPSYGIVRLTAPLAFIAPNFRSEAFTAYFSGIAAYLYGLRQRDYAYARAGISIEPIVRVEEHLHAIIPSIDVLVEKLHRLMPRATAGVA